MNKDEMIQIAKSKGTPSAELKELIGKVPEVDQLLAKHPNATWEMMHRLSESADKKTVALVASHPDIPTDLLEKLGSEHPLAMFKNSTFLVHLGKDKRYLNKFSGEKFANAFKAKSLPDSIIDWLVSQGKISYQVNFLIRSRDKRPMELVRRFYATKYPQVIGLILESNYETYLDWAKDLGFPGVLDASKPEETKRGISKWIKTLANQQFEMYKRLVPDSGPVSSFKGELVRAIGRIEGEWARNGMMDWGGRSGYYAKLVKTIETSLCAEKSFSTLVKAVVKADIQEIKRAASNGRILEPNRRKYLHQFDGEYLFESGTNKSFLRLNAMVTLCCQKNTENEVIPGTPSLSATVSDD